jgi:hypothetical protein
MRDHEYKRHGLTVEAVRSMTPEQRQAQIDEILAEGRRYLEVMRLLEHKAGDRGPGGWGNA